MEFINILLQLWNLKCFLLDASAQSFAMSRACPHCLLLLMQSLNLHFRVFQLRFESLNQLLFLRFINRTYKFFLFLLLESDWLNSFSGPELFNLFLKLPVFLQNPLLIMHMCHLIASQSFPRQTFRLFPFIPDVSFDSHQSCIQFFYFLSQIVFMFFQI